MRLRIGLILAAVFASLLLPISPVAFAVSSYASAPLNVTVTPLIGGLRVSWSNPTDIATGITGWVIEDSSNGTSGNWVVRANVSAGLNTYDITGQTATPKYIRIAAKTSAGTGTYGYPWTKLYGTTSPKNNSDNLSINYESGYGIGGSDTATLLSSASFSRVRYRMDTTIGGVSDYAETDFYKWVTTPTTEASSRTVAATINNLQVPVPADSTSGFVIQANVQDLNVYSSNSAVTNAAGITGRLEIWPWNYEALQNGLSPAGNNLKYDFDDKPVVGNSVATAGAFGSFQVHDITNSKTVFAWNFHSYNAGANDPDLGYGNNTHSNGQTDWTFCHENTATNGYCANPTYFRLQIFINMPVTPIADTFPPTATRVDSKTVAKNGDTITVKSNENGNIWLINQSVTVSAYSDITGAATSNKVSVSAGGGNVNMTMTLTGLADGIYNLYALDPFNNISSPVVATLRMDSTAPTANSIVVSSSGTSIILTANETITNSAQVNGIYTVSDSGTTISITGTSFSGNTATISLNRAIPAGASVSFAYNPSGGLASGRWIDIAGNEMTTITSRTITNNSTFSVTVSLSVPTTVSKGSVVSISADVAAAGKVTFSVAGKRIPGCINKSALGTTPITVSCSFKPALSGRQVITATLVPTVSSYTTVMSSVERFFLKRSTLR